MSDQTPAPAKRRWYQFSIATALIVVTIICAVLAQMRARAMYRNERRSAAYAVVEAGGWVEWDDSVWPKMSYFEKRLDDKPVLRMILPVGISLEEAERIQRLYPEVTVEWYSLP